MMQSFSMIDVKMALMVLWTAWKKPRCSGGDVNDLINSIWTDANMFINSGVSDSKLSRSW